MDPKGRVAIITGAGSGIGRATALALAGEGASLAIADLNEQGGRETVRLIEDAGGKAAFVHVDVTKRDDLKRMVSFAEQTFGGVDIFHNNAGIGTPQPRFPAAALELWEKTLTVDLWAVIAALQAVVPAMPGEQAETLAIEVKESLTKPPPRFNEGTLLSAMEGAGKLVDDEELREAMAERGLGTPATRAQTIEGLIYEGYVIRDGRELVVTQKGLSLITLLHNLDELEIDPAAKGYRVVIAGHSHKPMIKERDGVLYVNPGSAGPRRFRLPVALGELKVSGKKVRARIKELA